MSKAFRSLFHHQAFKKLIKSYSYSCQCWYLAIEDWTNLMNGRRCQELKYENKVIRTNTAPLDFTEEFFDYLSEMNMITIYHTFSMFSRQRLLVRTKWQDMQSLAKNLLHSFHVLAKWIKLSRQMMMWNVSRAPKTTLFKFVI